MSSKAASRSDGRSRPSARRAPRRYYVDTLTDEQIEKLAESARRLEAMGVRLGFPMPDE